MKKVLFRRKTLLRALRAATLAFLCWIGAQRAAQAQTALPGGPGYSNAASGSYAVNSGTTIASTSATGFSGSGAYSSPYAAVALGGGSLVNHGTLSINFNAPQGGFNSVPLIYAALAMAGTDSAYVHNYGTLSSVAGGANGSGLYFLASNSSSLTVVNENGATISGSGYYGYGINSQAADGTTKITNNSGGTISGTYTAVSAVSRTGAIIIENSGMMMADSTVSSHSGAYGIAAICFSGGSIAITNNTGGTIAASAASGSADGIQAGESSANAANVSVTNNGIVHAATTGSSPSTASGIYASSQGVLTVVNGGAVTASASHDTAIGIRAINLGAGDGNVTNDGAITATVTALSTGIALGISAAGNGALTVTNGGDITANNNSTSGIGGSAYGIAASAAGLLSVANNGTITASNTNIDTNIAGAYGIQAQSTSGSGVCVVNNGTINVSTGSGYGYGIRASSGGSLSVINNGIITLAGSGAGIYLDSVGTVCNTGTITTPNGSGRGIMVPDGSTVTLAGVGTVNGIISGGNSGTGSTLNFDLTVRANYKATVAALDAVIARGDYRVGLDGVKINGSFYDFSLFQTVTDGLVQGMLFSQAPGFQSMGATLDALSGSGNPHALALLNALGTVTDANLPAALAQLSSAKVSQQLLSQPVSQAVFQSMQLDSRLTQVRSGFAGGIDVSDFQFANGTVDPLLSQVQGRLYAYNPAPTNTLSDTPHALSSDEQFARWGTFLSGNAVLANQSATASQNRADSTTVDITAGADYRLNKNWAVGFLFGYGRTSADVDSFGSQVKGDQYRFGPYVGYSDGPWYANASGYFAVNQETGDRVIPLLGQTAHSNPDGTQYGFNADGGYEFKAGHLTYGPTGGLQYTHLDVNAYDESGSDADLNVASQHSDSLLSSLGAKADYDLHWKWNNSTVRPEVRASWLHEFEGSNSPINAAFDVPGSAGFTLAPAHQERESALVGGGVQDIFAGGSLLFLDYDAQVQNNYLAQSVTGGFKIAF